MATDILTVRNGELANILLSDVTGVSSEVAPFCSLYPEDINGDGVTEVPHAVSTHRGKGGGTSHRIDWYAYASDGTSTVALRTYHDWRTAGICICRTAGWARWCSPHHRCGRDHGDLFLSGRRDRRAPGLSCEITRLTGSSREIKAARGGRIILRRQPEAIYTAELLEANDGWAYGMTEEQLREAFSLITTEWSPGDS